MIGRLMSTLRKIPMKLNEGISKVFIDEKITTIIGGFIIIGILCIWGMTAQPQNLETILPFIKDLISFISGGIFGLAGSKYMNIKNTDKKIDP